MDYRLKKDLHGIVGYEVVVSEAGSVYSQGKDGNYYTDKFTRGLRPEVVESNPEWFEPACEFYEFKVGDWVVIVANRSGGFKEGTVCQIWDISERNSHVKHLNVIKAHTLIDLRPATPEEIESATKFTYEYLGTYTVHIENTGFLIIESRDNNRIFLPESAWREMGKRKGWL